MTLELRIICGSARRRRTPHGRCPSLGRFVLGSVGDALSPEVRWIRERYMGPVKQSLGVEKSADACDEGRAMPVDHALALAHEQGGPRRVATDPRFVIETASVDRVGSETRAYRPAGTVRRRRQLEAERTACERLVQAFAQGSRDVGRIDEEPDLGVRERRPRIEVHRPHEGTGGSRTTRPSRAAPRGALSRRRTSAAGRPVRRGRTRTKALEAAVDLRAHVVVHNAPAAAIAFAMPAPMPLAAPVTSATLPVRERVHQRVV